MTTRREYYKSRAEQLNVPQEIEPLPIKFLIEGSKDHNIYEVTTKISRRAEQILDELTQELREKLQELNAQEDMLQREDPAAKELQQEIQRWVELYRAIPKPSLIAIMEELHKEAPTQ